MMGITDSPYHACQAVTWDKCISMGDRIDPNNPFEWEEVVLKFLGTEECDCKSPWVFKQSVDGFLVVE